MIEPLRRRHRWLAPASFAAAVASVMVGVWVQPDAFVDAGGGRDSVLAAPPDATAAARPVPGMDGLRAALLPLQDGRQVLWLMAGTRLEAADILAYTSAAAPAPPGSQDPALPVDARLLGSVAPLGASRLTLAAPHGTQLIIFSLGQQRVLGSLALAAPTAEGR